MRVVVITSLLAIIFAYLSKYKNCRNGLEWGFLIVTFIACIHYNYGNDYMSYYGRWLDVQGMSFASIIAGDYRMGNEIGWYLLNRLFGFNNGYFVLVALLSIFQNYIYYKLIKTYVPRKWWWLALSIYLCSNSYYLLNFSMMRQGLAISLFVASVMLMNKKKFIPAVIGALLAPLIHKSAFICIPFILLGLLPLKKTRPFVIIILVTTFVMFVASNFISSLANNLLAYDEFESYEQYIVGDAQSISIGFLLNSIPYFIMLWGLWNQSNALEQQEKVIVILSFIGFVFYPISTATGAQMIQRLGIYFSVFSIAVVPSLYSRIKDITLRTAFTSLFVLLLLYSYYAFFHSEVYGKSYSDFHTIFSVIF